MKRPFRIAAVTAVMCLCLGAAACSGPAEEPSGTSSAAVSTVETALTLRDKKDNFDRARSALVAVDQRGRDQVGGLSPALDPNQVAAYRATFEKSQAVRDGVTALKEKSVQLSAATRDFMAQAPWADKGLDADVGADALDILVALADSPWGLGAIEGAANLQKAGPMRAAFAASVAKNRDKFTSVRGVASAKDGNAALDLVLGSIHEHGLANAFLDLVWGKTSGHAQSPDSALTTLASLVSVAGADGPTSAKAVASAMDLVRAQKLTAIDEAIKVENNSGLVRGIKGLGVAYGIVQAGSNAANGNFVAAVTSMVAKSSDGAVVLGQTAHSLRWAMLSAESAEDLVKLGMKVGPVTDTLSALLNLATNWDPSSRLLMAGDVLSVLGAIAEFSAVLGPEGVVIAGIGLGVQMLAGYLADQAAANARHNEMVACLKGAGITGALADALASANFGQLESIQQAGVAPADVRWFGALTPVLLVDTHSGGPQVDGLASMKRVFALTAAQETALLHVLPKDATSTTNDPPGAIAVHLFLRDTSELSVGLGATPSRSAWLDTLRMEAARTPGPGGTAMKNAAAYLGSM